MEAENRTLLIFGCISLAISLFVHSIYNNHELIQSEFPALAISVRDLSSMYEYISEDCRDHANEDQIMNDINKMRASLTNLIEKHASIVGLLSLKTYCSIHNFSHEVDQIQSVGKSICSLQLKTPEQIEIERNQILDNINKDQAKRQNIPYAIREYFQNIHINPHSPDKCPTDSTDSN